MQIICICNKFALLAKAMKSTSSRIAVVDNKTSLEDSVSCTLYVCTSCRGSGVPRYPKENRPGFILFRQLKDAVSDCDLHNRVEVKPAECLSICPRPCGVAINTPGSWAYLFGDQRPEHGVEDILECLSLYLQSNDGFMARNERPKSLRSSILGRIPPLGDK